MRPVEGSRCCECATHLIRRWSPMMGRGADWAGLIDHPVPAREETARRIAGIARVPAHRQPERKTCMMDRNELALLRFGSSARSYNPHRLSLAATGGTRAFSAASHAAVPHQHQTDGVPRDDQADRADLQS